MSLTRSYTRDEIVYTSRAMKMFGGSFAKCIGEALVLADTANCTKLIVAFPELIDKYGPGSHFYSDVYRAENEG